nr:MAG: hypothetical protein DIU55_07635 [Bacillota bacterium]
MTRSLERLFRTGDYRGCEVCGRRLLRAGGLAPAQRLRVLVLVERCRRAAGRVGRISSARLRLISAAMLRGAGRHQQAAQEAFRALLETETLSPLAVRAQLFLSDLAAATGRLVEALAFALAARTAAAAGGMGGMERRASDLLAAHLRAGGWTAFAELAGALAAQGVDVYEYLDLDELISVRS